MKNLIKKILRENLNEYNEYDSFLSNYETATKYAYENIEDVAESFDAYEEDKNDIQAEYSRDNYIERIELYVDKYNELKNSNKITIYRLIKLNSIKDLDIKDIGKHWSFDENGVGAYGERHPNIKMMKTGEPYILEAIINPKDIDWIYGFQSFIWYGEDQWECALNKGTNVKIIKINGEELKKPINAIVGDH